MKLEKHSTIGAIVAAAACPICFPKLALVGGLIGLGYLVEYEFYFLIASQVMMLIALGFSYRSYRLHKKSGILILSIFSVSLFFVSLYVFPNEYLSYLSLLGMVAALIWQIKNTNNGSNKVQQKSA